MPPASGWGPIASCQLRSPLVLTYRNDRTLAFLGGGAAPSPLASPPAAGWTAPARPPPARASSSSARTLAAWRLSRSLAGAARTARSLEGRHQQASRDDERHHRDRPPETVRSA